jgi:catechol 2,3-dioxygenase-like lactoylglutathione lyase family enzyme
MKRTINPPAIAIQALLLLAISLGISVPLAPASEPEKPVAHFHHVNLNTVDPKAAIDFYTSKFDCERARFAGLEDAVWTQKSWMLFNKVKTPPPWELTSAIWHFGWGAEDMKAAYQKQLDMKTKFFTPISPLGASFFYAYVEGPDHALIEMNTANHHRFGHLHLFSEDPVAAGDWYVKNFGATVRNNGMSSRTPSFISGFQVGPNSSLMLDNVNIIIFPIQYSKKAYADHWKGVTEMTPTKGRVVDHIGVSFENLTDALERLRKGGVHVTDEIQTTAGGKVKFAFIEGPDKIRIELVEGQAAKQ